jgi:hypothetical protein
MKIYRFHTVFMYRHSYVELLYVEDSNFVFLYLQLLFIKIPSIEFGELRFHLQVHSRWKAWKNLKIIQFLFFFAVCLKCLELRS